MMMQNQRGLTPTKDLCNKHVLLALADGSEDTVRTQQALLHKAGIAPRWEHWKGLLMNLSVQSPGEAPCPRYSDAARFIHKAHEKTWRESFERNFIAAYPLPPATPRVVKASNLALRFYAADGWYLEELQMLLKRGSIDCGHPNEIDPYFILGVGSLLHVDGILERTSELQRSFGSDPGVTDRDYMLEKMW